MRKFYFNIISLVPFVTFVHLAPVLSGVYDWKTPTKNISKNISSSILFEGSAFDMEWLVLISPYNLNKY